ncbi:FYVE zinc finger [Venustampulla echinocandica]|uniref:FYVE zinc finger n=1 Tax=Venustampulla echinocandica TaxID=2656787 RepID=A0A370TGX9_9HELO|nr:FYVE zinc finger [Venustampulla echinocandica]RDL34457.1 FYVE zinc finger [Venustampulla echinocandica]
MHPSVADQCIVPEDAVGSAVLLDAKVHTPSHTPASETTNAIADTSAIYSDMPPNSSLEMVDQCIVCLEDLTTNVDEDIHELQHGNESAGSITKPPTRTNQQLIALIKPCGHILHDDCLREWSQKANSCPFCRHTFNLVEVLDTVGGTVLSEYAVEDKKQVASTEFDPAWIEDTVEEEEIRPCPVCGMAHDEDVLLLCDLCDAPYHTYCIGLSSVPAGQWFCMECMHEGAAARNAVLREALHDSRFSQVRRFPRTQGSIRRTRERVRADHWYGTWSLFSNRVHDAVGLDLDFSDDDQAVMTTFRRAQRRPSSESREFRRWQQRLNIASRQGARDAFRVTVPRVRSPTPSMSAETRQESRAWGAFERAKEMDTGVVKNRKRKSRSSATSAASSPSESSSELPREPERKLKRPRTRRVLTHPESSSSTSMAQPTVQPNRQMSPPPHPAPESNSEPSFLSSLLKEVERGATSDDDTSRTTFGATAVSGGYRVTSPSIEYCSTGASPSRSSSHTPRATSITPPPHISKRHASPPPLSSRVEPIYPRSDYSPNRSPGGSSKKTEQDPSSPTTELRQPRPRRQNPRPLALSRSPDSSPVRTTMSAEAKEGINKIVKSALAPYWRSAEISKEQYADINRDVSRKLYEVVADRDTSNDKEKWEKIASVEVATAVQGVKI